MFLNQLAPQNNLKSYIPHFYFDDKADVDYLRAFVPNIVQNSRNLTDREKWEIGIGMIDHKLKMEGKNEDIDVRHYSSDYVKDVRLLFRNSTDDKEPRVIGSKIRIYSTGKNIESDELETQSIDTGFLTSISSGDIFQNALASSNLWTAMYSIGAKAIFTKFNYESSTGNKKVGRKYRTVGLLREGYRDYNDVKDIDHILTPACWECQIDDPVEFFGKDILDGIAHIFFYARNIDEVFQMLMGDDVHYWGNSHNPLASLELTEDEANSIIDVSNTEECNYSHDVDFTQGKSEGINLIPTINAIADLLEND